MKFLEIVHHLVDDIPAGGLHCIAFDSYLYERLVIYHSFPFSGNDRELTKLVSRSVSRSKLRSDNENEISQILSTIGCHPDVINIPWEKREYLWDLIKQNSDMIVDRNGEKVSCDDFERSNIGEDGVIYPLGMIMSAEIAVQENIEMSIDTLSDDGRIIFTSLFYVNACISLLEQTGNLFNKESLEKAEFKRQRELLLDAKNLLGGLDGIGTQEIVNALDYIDGIRRKLKEVLSEANDNYGNFLRKHSWCVKCEKKLGMIDKILGREFHSQCAN